MRFGLLGLLATSVIISINVACSYLNPSQLVSFPGFRATYSEVDKPLLKSIAALEKGRLKCFRKNSYSSNKSPLLRFEGNSEATTYETFWAAEIVDRNGDLNGTATEQEARAYLEKLYREKCLNRL